jgi:N-methylhydantoinase A/oxoprolinase/acetone carboxylase beta subunit
LWKNVPLESFAAATMASTEVSSQPRSPKRANAASMNAPLVSMVPLFFSAIAAPPVDQPSRPVV